MNIWPVHKRENRREEIFFNISFWRVILVVFLITLYGDFKLALAQSASGPAESSQPSESDATQESIISYEHDYFLVFNPINAFDMVERLPGFTIGEGDSVRGFGGAAGNILVNGKRPSSKGQTLVDILSQIPAETVERIDLIRRRVPGIDMRGQSVVANVIKRGGQTGGVVELELRLSEDGHITPNGEATLTGEVKKFGYTLGVRRFAFRDLDKQNEILFDPDRMALEVRPEEVAILPDDWTVTANVERDFGGWSFHLNNEIFLSNFTFREVSPSFSADDGTFLRSNVTFLDNKRTRIEVGGDIERKFSDSFSLKLIGLQTFGEFSSDQEFTEDRADSSFRAISQNINESSGESILRAIMTFSTSKGGTYEFGTEGAYNFLDSTVDLFIDGGAGPMPQDLPISNAKVEEYRGELFGNASWALDSNLTIETGLTVESSSLRQSGDVNADRVFVFFKPSLNITYQVSGKDQLRFSLLREVTQLDFTDFVSSVTLNDQTTDLGNPELEPQRDWISRLEWERRFNKSDSIKLLLEYKPLHEVQALVPIENLFDAPGNIGNGTSWRARIEWQFSLEKIGLANAIFEGSYQHSQSEVTDPVTGQKRPLSFLSSGRPFRVNEIQVEFRQDFPQGKWSWGWDYEYGSEFQFFRIDEFSRIQNGAQDIDIFIETKRFLDMTMRLEFGIRERRDIRTRTLFDGPRSEGIISAIEERNRSPEKQLIFQVTKTF